jgi:hypothetical protein
MSDRHLIEALAEEGELQGDLRRLICPECNEPVPVLVCTDIAGSTCADPGCPVCRGTGWYYPEIGDECRECGTDLVPDPRFIEEEDEE